MLTTQINVSFIELAPYVEIISYDVLNPLLLPEGCFQSVLQFNTQVVQDQDVILEFEISGSANSEDYDIEDEGGNIKQQSFDQNDDQRFNTEKHHKKQHKF